MEAIKRNIPNFITSLNLLSGCLGIIFLINRTPVYASYAMFIAAFFDFIDGFVARLLKVSSPIGKDLDSLADVVTFGVLPGLMAMNMVVATQNIDYRWAFICLLIPVFSAFRLAIFNNDTQQSHSFKGLATPANGLLWASLNICYFSSIEPVLSIGNLYVRKELLLSKWVNSDANVMIRMMDDYPIILILLAVLLSILLVSRIDLMAFKFKGFGWKENKWKYILLILCLPLVIFLGFASAPIILLLYIILSQIHFRTTKHEI